MKKREISLQHVCALGPVAFIINDNNDRMYLNGAYVKAKITR